jgi:hypothetical protein
MDSLRPRICASRDVVSRAMTLRFVMTWLRTKKDHVSIIVLLLYVDVIRLFCCISVDQIRVYSNSMRFLYIIHSVFFTLALHLHLTSRRIL